MAGVPVAALPLPPGLTVPLRPTGRPLAPVLQAKMERLLGTSLANVRIHVLPQAAALGTLAYTSGEDVVFAPGQYAPETPWGVRLLAHELAHVVQQRAGRVRNPFGQGGALVQDPRLEAEAERVAARAAMLRPPAPGKLPVAVWRPAHSGALQRMESKSDALTVPLLSRAEGTTQVEKKKRVQATPVVASQSEWTHRTVRGLTVEIVHIVKGKEEKFELQEADGSVKVGIKRENNFADCGFAEEGPWFIDHLETKNQRELEGRELKQSRVTVRGLGALLTYLAVKRGKELKATRVGLGRGAQTARQFYEKMGFQYGDARDFNAITPIDRVLATSKREALASWTQPCCSCCFLTSACVAARQLPIDCLELQTMRAFRDDWLASQPGGPRLIAEYQDLAPAIVTAIESRSDAAAVYEKIFAVIENCMERFSAGDFAAVLAAYGGMVLELRQNLLEGSSGA